MNYSVTLAEGTFALNTSNLLLSPCAGTVNSKQTLLWFSGECSLPSFDGGVYGPLYYGSIRPATGESGGTGEYILRMTDLDTNYWWTFTGNTLDLSNTNYPGEVVSINASGELWYKERVRDGKKWVVIQVPTGIYISIGEIIIEPL